MEGTFPGEPGLATISDDKQFVAVVTSGGLSDPFGEPPSKSIPTLMVWKLDTGAKLKEMPAPELPVVALWFSDGGHALSFLDSNGNLQTTDIRSSRQIRSAKIEMQVLEKYPLTLRHNCLSANHKLFAFHNRSDGVHLVDLEQNNPTIVIPMPERFPHVLALSHDNKMVATAPVQITRATKTIDPSIRLWHAESGMLLGTLEVPDSAIASMAFSQDGAWLVTGTDMGTALVWNVKQALEKASR